MKQLIVKHQVSKVAIANTESDLLKEHVIGKLLEQVLPKLIEDDHVDFGEMDCEVGTEYMLVMYTMTHTELNEILQMIATLSEKLSRTNQKYTMEIVEKLMSFRNNGK